MSDVAISVENLGKCYVIRHRQTERYVALRDVIARKFRAPWRRLFGSGRKTEFQETEEFWALKGVSFNIKQGEVVGIIGRNGAGKSTLLKILSRITEPTTGRVRLQGRVASLLEVGTGFHPELTGRENISLNGAILGMGRTEIRRKFDEIVAFAEIEKFLDTPVKRYSSGMYVRLAFAVAAHLEPEILIVDEVLAVGDANFQKKCLNKLETVGKAGRTVLFVSHNMPTVTRLCSRIILLRDGQVARQGPCHEVVRAYLSSHIDSTASRQWESHRAPGDDVARLRSVQVLTEDRRVSDTFDIRRPIGVEIEFDVFKAGHLLVPSVHLMNEEGVSLFIALGQDPKPHRRPRSPGRHRSTAWIPGNFLAEGNVIVAVGMSSLNPNVIHFHEREVAMFHVQDSLDGDSARGDYAGTLLGVVRPLLRWTNEHLSAQPESALPDLEISK